MIQSNKDKIEERNKTIKEFLEEDGQSDSFEVNLKFLHQFNEEDIKKDLYLNQLERSSSKSNQLHSSTSIVKIEPNILKSTPQLKVNIVDLPNGSKGIIFQQKEDSTSQKNQSKKIVNVQEVDKKPSDEKNKHSNLPNIQNKINKTVSEKLDNQITSPSLSKLNRQLKKSIGISSNPYITKSTFRPSLPIKFSKPPISNQSQSEQYSIFKNNPPKKFFDSKTSAENNVLVDLQNRIIHLPAYMRIRIKKVLSLELSELSMELNITLVLNIFYGQLPEEIVNVIMQRTVLIFEKQQPMLLDNCKNKQEGLLQTRCVNQKHQKSIKFTIRRKIDVYLDADVRWTPFQVIYPIISVQLPSINWTPTKPLKDQTDVTDWQIRFNLMDYHNRYLKLSYDDEQKFGFYRLAHSRIRSMVNRSRVNNFKDFYINSKLLNQRIARKRSKVEYFEINLPSKVLKTQQQDKMVFWFNHCYKSQENSINGQVLCEAQSQIEKKQNMMKKLSEKLFTREHIEKQVQNYYQKSQAVSVFNVENFAIPMYKEPGFALSTIFLPLLLLSIINLAIFFQGVDLHDRIASVSLLMLAFVSLIPTLKSQLPPSFEVSMIQWIVYVQTYTTALVLARSLDIMDQKEYEFKIQNQYLFLLAAIITGQVILLLLVMLGWYYFHKKPYYNKKPLQIQIKQKFSTRKLKWKNTELLKELIIKEKKFLTDQELREMWPLVVEKNKQKNKKE